MTGSQREETLYKMDVAGKEDESFREKAVKLGRKFDKKVGEEKQQFQDMGGISHIGEYLIKNVVSALSQISSALDAEDVAGWIEDWRADVEDFGRKFDKKLGEERQQLQDMGGLSHVGEYLAENVVSALSKGASALDAEDVARWIESQRADVENMGRKFDKKLGEERQQLQDMGGISHIGEYLAENAISVLSKGASALNAEDVARWIEEQRLKAEEQGRKFDEKVGEERQQLQDMGGVSHIGEYLTKNVVSALSQISSVLGAEDTARWIEEQRLKVEEQGRKFDKKLGEERQQLQDMGGISHIGEYLAENVVSALSQLEILQDCPVQKKRYSFETNTVIPTPVYKKGELFVQNISDDQTREVSFIDGKKHGAEITRNGQYEIIDVKLYDHGMAIDMSGHNVEIKTDVDENGAKHNYCLLNGQLFGTETFIKDNKILVRFYEKGGIIMGRNENSKVSYRYTDVSENTTAKQMAEIRAHQKKR